MRRKETHTKNMVAPLSYVAKSIEWNSRLLDDPSLVLQILEAAEP